MLLPKIDSIDSYRLLRRNNKNWLHAIHGICDKHNLDKKNLTMKQTGTHIVFFNGIYYIKLFCPLWKNDYISEKLLLKRLVGLEKFKVPQLIMEGKIEEWNYLIITSIRGLPLNEVSQKIQFDEKKQIIIKCGEFLNNLHKIPINGLDEINKDWQKFITNQMIKSKKKYLKSNNSNLFKTDILQFLDSNKSLSKHQFIPKLLNADLTDEHILVYLENETWKLGGFIDFGDAMIGHSAYDLIAPCLCLTYDNPILQEAFFKACGYTIDQLTRKLVDQITLYILIHPYITIPNVFDDIKKEVPNNLIDFQKKLCFFYSK